MSGWIGVVVVGLIAGYLAGLIMKGRGFGLVGNIIVGVIGAAIGSVPFDARGTIGSIVSATVGAVILLWVVSFLKKR